MTDKEKSSEHKVLNFVYYFHTVSLLYLVHYVQDMHRNTNTHIFMQNITDNYLVWATDFNKIPYYQI